MDNIETCCYELNSVRNDFIFIHITAEGHDFLTIHKLTEEYYNHLSSDIDSLLEICMALNPSARINLNRYTRTYIEGSSFSDVLELCQRTVDILEKARDSVSSNGHKSEIDGMLEYWEKQARFIALRFCL